MLTYHLEEYSMEEYYIKSYVAEVSGRNKDDVIPKTDLRKDIVIERHLDVWETSTIDSSSSFNNKLFIYSSWHTIIFKWLNVSHIHRDTCTSSISEQKPDAKISMHARIDDMVLSPCQRFVYIACFPFDKESLEISCFDLANLDFVGRILNFPTPSVDAAQFSLSMSVSTNFVAVVGDGLLSGVLIDRHYGVVCGAFPCSEYFININRKSGECIVSSWLENDQHAFKVRRCRRQMRERKVEHSMKSIHVQDSDILFTLNHWTKTASDIFQHSLLDENEILFRHGRQI